MQTKITYIFHNCFILNQGQQTFLFDYPGDNYLNDIMRDTVIAKIKDTDLYVFSSHVHGDHFNRKITNLSSYPTKITYLLSSDIAKKYSSFKKDPDCHIIYPDQLYQVGSLKINSFLSNDQGVAFLININNFNIYFGGDLANWNWDGLTSKEKQLYIDYFDLVLTKLQTWPITIAFSNTDQRLANWSGAAQFIKTIKPQIFVPMHTFGKTESISQFINEHPGITTQIFQYEKTGDNIVLEL